MREPVIIVGGGLAGLACAISLEARAIPYLLLEASDRVGGRVATDEVDGFLLDRGFQVHFPAYPNAARLLEGADLDLRPWRNGALVWEGARLRVLDRDRPLRTLRDAALGPLDLLRLLRLSARALALSVEAIRDLPDETTLHEIRRRGFSERALRRFFRPFYGGVFVDPPLDVSQRQFLFVQKMLGLAPASLPNRGMAAIPRALAARLPAERIALGTPVDEILLASDVRVNGVRAGGERLPASAVVLATDADVAQGLSGLPLARGWLSSVTLYFESERAVVDAPYIVLNGTGKGLVNEVVPVTSAAPGYASEGRHLVAAVVLGDPPEPDAALADGVCREIRSWFPQAGELRLIHLYRNRRHQLTQRPGDHRALPETPPGLIVAGEVTTNCSIDGAIESGLRAAEAIR